MIDVWNGGDNMGAGKHENQFITELEPFVLIDRTNRPQCTLKSQALRDLHEFHCDSLGLIQNGMRQHAALWNNAIVTYDTVMIERDQCRDIRKRNQLQLQMDIVNGAIERHERNAELCEIAYECAIDSAYMQRIGKMPLGSIIPAWYWKI
jgi:hypothetical protein